MERQLALAGYRIANELVKQMKDDDGDVSFVQEMLQMRMSVSQRPLQE